MKNLDQCPLCGNPNITTDEMDFIGTGKACIHAICEKCGASAPVDVWNKRTTNWRDVNDGLPDERCIAYTPEHDEVGTWRIIPKGLFRQAASEASHWIPMPEISSLEGE